MKVPPGLKKSAQIPNLPQTGWGFLTKYKAIFLKGGVTMAKSKLEIELLGLINEKSASEIEKVERYCSLVRISRNLDKSISKDGTMIKVVNGNQEFLKPNPAISEKVKINTALIKLDEFFEEKRAEKGKNNDFNEEDLYAD